MLLARFVLPYSLLPCPTRVVTKYEDRAWIAEHSQRRDQLDLPSIKETLEDCEELHRINAKLVDTVAKLEERFNRLDAKCSQAIETPKDR